MSLINPCKNDIILITICQVNNYKMLKKKKMKIVVSSINEKCKIHICQYSGMSKLVQYVARVQVQRSKVKCQYNLLIIISHVFGTQG